MRPQMYSVSIPLAIILTALSIIYQRSTGPTYPKKFGIETSQGEKLRVILPRSQENINDASIEIPAPSENASGEVFFKRYPTNDAWTRLSLQREKALLTGKLPTQPAAGKLSYYVKLYDAEKIHEFGTEKDPIYIRFKGAVPFWILTPHIVCMFIAMLFSSIAGIEAVYRTKQYYKLTLITLSFLFIGGMVLGPLVQKHAFGVYWAGFPYGYDLTDNKLLIGVLIWAFAAAASRKKDRPYASVIAAIVLILVYSIPHSRMGSEFNYQQGEVQTQKKF